MIERKIYPVSGLKTADQTGTIEAIVSVFNLVDFGNEIVRPGFFEKSISRKLPKGVWAHDWKQPIAKTLEARELHPGDRRLPASLRELGGAYIKGQFNLETQRGREAYSDIKFGIVDEFSIGYSVLKEGKDAKTGARELIEGDWKEWSPVLVGMNDQTQLLSIKHSHRNENLSTRETSTLRARSLEMEAGVIATLYGNKGSSELEAQYNNLKLMRATRELGLKCREFLNGPHRRGNRDAIEVAKLRLESELIRLRALHTLNG